jgi:hypothetical protein
MSVMNDQLTNFFATELANLRNRMAAAMRDSDASREYRVKLMIAISNYAGDQVYQTILADTISSWQAGNPGDNSYFEKNVHLSTPLQRQCAMSSMAADLFGRLNQAGYALNCTIQVKPVTFFSGETAYDHVIQAYVDPKTGGFTTRTKEIVDNS